MIVFDDFLKDFSLNYMLNYTKTLSFNVFRADMKITRRVRPRVAKYTLLFKCITFKSCNSSYWILFDPK
jgi:hypothetical protein